MTGRAPGSPRLCRGRLAPLRLLREICFRWDGNVGGEDNRILAASGGCGRWPWWRCRAVRISGGSPGIIIHQLFCLGGHSNSSMFSWRSAHGEPFSTANGLKGQCASCFLCLWITMTACLCSLLAVNGLRLASGTLKRQTNSICHNDHDVRFHKSLLEPVLDVLAEVRANVVQITNVCVWNARQG